jgi:uncharacterized damage-inducible protein DinB
MVTHKNCYHGYEWGMIVSYYKDMLLIRDKLFMRKYDYNNCLGTINKLNAIAFRQFFDYHFSENRKIWDNTITQLSQEQFTQGAGYSHGSIRNQVVHMMSVDDTWFSGLRGVEIPESLDPATMDDRNVIRAYWDSVEQKMRNYLDNLQDNMLNDKPFADDEDKDLVLWQVLLHVVNHGTDHRAQLLRSLNDLGYKTTSQDFIFYVYDHL